jgi:hypothetical protein
VQPEADELPRLRAMRFKATDAVADCAQVQSKPSKTEAPGIADIQAAFAQLSSEEVQRWRERLLEQPHLRVALAALLGEQPLDELDSHEREATA